MSSTSDQGRGGRLLIDEPASGVARLTISHPAKRGALDRPILDALVATLAGLDARCVIITGEGTTFSAGYDLSQLGLVDADTAPNLAPINAAAPFEDALDALAAHPHPTVAALNGHTIGGGLELALACDLRLAAAPIRLGMPPAKLGLVYSADGIRRFIEAIGAPRTRELFLVGRRIEANTALDWGLVNAVVAADQLAAQAVSLAAEIAGNAPLSLTGTKRVIAAVLQSRAALDPGVADELDELRQRSFASADFREALRAFADKRSPSWEGR